MSPTVEINTEPGRCRFCAARLDRTFVDLGMSPLCETYPLPSEIHRGEIFFPLHVYLCENCLLVQIEAYERPENIFSEYPY
ncbi:MAG: class I SAM-dependent methyltransferase, partial [Terracidiphilus sp.]